ncbi:MAG: hypothetical protein ACRDKB_03355 [Actinomycetota bacterium]
MKPRTLIAALTAATLLLGLAAPAGLAAKKKKKKKGPVVVATDPADDWGANVDPNIAPAGIPLGMELVEAAVGLSEDKTAINFILKLAGPTAGGIPEGVRYGWEFSVDGNAYQLNGGRTELLRGMCNPLITDPACPPNFGDPGALTNFPFFVRSGSCTVGADCRVHVVVNAIFDATAGTITIPVPLEAVEAKLGSTIAPLPGLFGAIYAAPGVVVTTNGLPHDAIASTKTVKLPKK